MRRASRGRFERPESWREVSGMSGSVLGWVSGLDAGSEGGGVEGWPFCSWGEAMLAGYEQIVPLRSPLAGSNCLDG